MDQDILVNLWQAAVLADHAVAGAGDDEHELGQGQANLRRKGRRGPFLGCSGYPKCKNTGEVPAKLMEEMGLNGNGSANGNGHAADGKGTSKSKSSKKSKGGDFTVKIEKGLKAYRGTEAKRRGTMLEARTPVVVNKDVAPHTRVGGSPAVKLGDLEKGDGQ